MPFGRLSRLLLARVRSTFRPRGLPRSRPVTRGSSSAYRSSWGDGVSVGLGGADAGVLDEGAALDAHASGPARQRCCRSPAVDSLGTCGGLPVVGGWGLGRPGLRRRCRWRRWSRTRRRAGADDGRIHWFRQQMVPLRLVNWFIFSYAKRLMLGIDVFGGIFFIICNSVFYPQDGL